MKKILILLSLAFMLLIGNVNANVDSTTLGDFKYDTNTCVLEVNFNLGGHHNYTRQYDIRQPGYISIGDTAHTSLSEGLNIKICGCRSYKPICNPINYTSGWEDIGTSIDKGPYSTGTILGPDEYEENGKVMKKIKRMAYNGVLAIGNTIVSARAGNYVAYKEIGGSRQTCNDTMSVARDYNNGGYCTGLDLWDYQQHKYTTTKVNVKSANKFSCKGYQYNDSSYADDVGYVSTGINFSSYDPNSAEFEGKTIFNCQQDIGNLTMADFGGPITINGQTEKDDWGIVIEATGALNISGLKQKAIAEIGGRKIFIDKVETSIKERDITLSQVSKPITPRLEVVGTFNPINAINLTPINTNFGYDVVSKRPGNYQIVFSFFSGEQLMGTYQIPLTIIPNNEFKLGTLTKTTSGDKYADGSETITMCQEFTDSFGNKVNRANDILNNDLVKAQDPYTIISNARITKDSKVCFDIARFAPGLPGIIDIYIPKHEINVSLTPTNTKVHFALDFGTTNVLTGESSNYNNSSCIGNNCSMVNCPAIQTTTGTPKATSAQINNACKVSGFFYYDKNGDDTNTKGPNATEFKSPFSLDLKVKSGSGDDEWNGQPSVGLDQLYRLALIKNTEIGITSGKLESISKTNINTYSSGSSVNGHVWERFTTANTTPNVNSADSNLNKWTFTGAINVNKDENALLAPVVKADKILISYRILGIDVKYLLLEAKVEGCERDTLGVKILGNLQADGKASITGQENNFSDLSTSEMRGIIKKSITQLTSGMTSGNIAGGIKYIVGNITLPDADFSKYETIVVKNGNVFINGDITSMKGIIVLKDNYNVNNDYKTSGNVYIANDVENINAVIYADGTLMSSKGVSYVAYSAEELTTPLHIKGSLFTRNTIGGSISGSSNKILLPGGQATTNSTLAGYYDLNNIRVWGSSCSADTPFPLTIEYDSKLQTSPPKGFSR